VNGELQQQLSALLKKGKELALASAEGGAEAGAGAGADEGASWVSPSRDKPLTRSLMMSLYTTTKRSHVCAFVRREVVQSALM
jgi:hypothetical protein